ncbi:molybdopterin-guanine dinucleotide biosynthesis protein B [Paenibacillus glycanilyticus]|uniref:Molybdopterin-guanine dinucleotide biosynthesis protein MobB n=1 Tax=Paenibacillus glycanilyticus TaxID=126569 RepID=A0ABQ6GG38_9BACL|nr:molybdopterin-guanine dinucleotide biosynthesis protein B [Paenibacillus glycanilyticus]GLX69215.1 molybdopterin-guanine dinucleotide biosynthesis protein MobB [Paenibacillus glycanilyticus]
MAAAVFQITGYKNTGKTTLMCRLIDDLVSRGIKVATIKHDGHEFEAEAPHADTARHRNSGAIWSAITSSERTAIVKEEPSRLLELIGEAPADAFVLVEGFKQEVFPKLVIIRHADDERLLVDLKGIKAVAVWPEYRLREDHIPAGAMLFEINDVQGIGDYIRKTAWRSQS